MASFFTENTFIPVSLVITVVVAAFWIGSIFFQTAALQTRVEKMAERDHERDLTTTEILQRLERIDTRVDYIYESIKSDRERHRP
jgi:hypothetical protein